MISAAEAIKESATSSNDYKMLAKMGDLNMIFKKVKYHQSCKNQYIKRAQRDQLPISPKKISHDVAFKKMYDYINENLV